MGDGLPPGAEIAAVVFDMDGVLLNSEPLHHATVNAILAEEGKALSLDDYLGYVGTTLADTWGDLARKLALKRDYGYYAGRYDEEILRQYAEHSVAAPCAASLVDGLRARRLPLAVASSSRTAWVEACLAGLGLRDHFSAIVTGDMVSHGKPDPEIYLKAASALGIAPQRCLAIEDAPKGVEAAARAGMTVFAVDTPYTAQLPVPGAALRLATLCDFALSWLDDEQPASESVVRRN
jgi:HAD superfamily hydrolase (TIGR01509 family)